MILSVDQIERYHRDGFVIGPKVLDGERLATLRSEIAHVVQTLPAGNRPENTRNPHERSATFLDLCLDGPIVDAAEQLLGESGLLMWGTYGFAKPAHDGLPVDWHQDGRYYPLQPMATVSAWLALDDSRRENGCLEMIPGSHRARRFLPHVMHENWGRDTALPLAVAEADAAGAVALEMEAGQFEIHDPYTVHGSRPNRSDQARWGIQIIYSIPSVRLDVTDQEVMGLAWHTIKLFRCRTPRQYHYPAAPDEVHTYVMEG
ncbi:MAG: phytanoyl-CoA dioxygenase family protein [Alphaproteobacteria bacterium]